jgi:hypothetical protein
VRTLMVPPSLAKSLCLMAFAAISDVHKMAPSVRGHSVSNAR